MSKRKYSTIWLHFDHEDDGQRARCKHCLKTLSIADGCHSNLKRHLKTKHSLTPLNLEPAENSTDEIVKFEDHFDDQTMGSTEIAEHEMTEFVSSSPPDFKSNTPKVKKRKYSVIWLYFDDEGGQKAKCKYCKATLSFSGGSHGNLRRHMRLKHPLTHLNIEDHVPIPQGTYSFEDRNGEDPLTSNQLTGGNDGDQKTTFVKLLPIHKVQDPDWNEGREYVRPPSKRKHSAIWAHFKDVGCQRAQCKYCATTISFYGGCHGNLKRHFKLKHPQMLRNIESQLAKAKGQTIVEEPVEQPSETTNIGTTTDEIDRQVLRMLSKGYHSLRLVEEPEFQKLIHDVSNCPGYKLPSKKTLSRNMLPVIQMEIIEDIKEKIQSATAVCLTIDGWTSTSNVKCSAVTAHYINAETILTSHVLGYSEFENRYNSENFFNFLQNIISDFEINKVAAIVSTNENNIVAAIQEGEWPGITCFAYSLNTTVQAAIAEIADAINKARKIIEYFHTTADALKELQTTQKQMNLPETKLKKDVPKMWNSTFEMLRTVYQMKDLVTSVLLINRPDLMLAAEDWEIIGESLQILKPFYEVTVEISVESSFNLSKVTVLYNLLDRHIAKCLPTNEEVTAMVINLQMGIASCFGNLEKNKLYAESTILDPRFKRKGFRNESSYEQALNDLRNKICSIQLNNADDEAARSLEGNSLWEAYDLEFSDTVAPENNTAASIREFDKYMNEEYLDRRKDPLLWWKERKHLYPRLYLYAVKRLCIVASSVPCEQIYSTAGQILSQRRSILKPNKVGGLVFLHNM